MGEARLDQDEKIQGKFLAGWSTTLNQSIKSADKARAAVQNARLQLDAVKSRTGGNTEEHNKALEQAEDVFVEKVDEATSVMRNVLDTPEPLRNLVELAKAQAEYHQRAADILEEVAKSVGDLQMEQETEWRKARDA